MDANEIADPERAELQQTEPPIEMANLPASQTGIDGAIFVSTRMGPHEPRVKHYERQGGHSPAFRSRSRTIPLSSPAACRSA